jgi:hypothetical protein
VIIDRQIVPRRKFARAGFANPLTVLHLLASMEVETKELLAED